MTFLCLWCVVCVVVFFWLDYFTFFNQNQKSFREWVCLGNLNVHFVSGMYKTNNDTTNRTPLAVGCLFTFSFSFWLIHCVTNKQWIIVTVVLRPQILKRINVDCKNLGWKIVTFNLGLMVGLKVWWFFFKSEKISTITWQDYAFLWKFFRKPLWIEFGIACLAPLLENPFITSTQLMAQIRFSAGSNRVCCVESYPDTKWYVVV